MIYGRTAKIRVYVQLPNQITFQALKGEKISLTIGVNLYVIKFVFPVYTNLILFTVLYVRNSRIKSHFRCFLFVKYELNYSQIYRKYVYGTYYSPEYVSRNSVIENVILLFTVTIQKNIGENHIVQLLVPISTDFYF